MSSFKIGIQTMGNKRHTLDVKDSDTVLEIKKKIETDLQIGPVDEQKLIYMGKILKDEQTLEAAKIKANDMLVVMIAKKKVAAPSTSSSSTAAPAAAPATAATTTAPTATTAPAATPSTPAPAPLSTPATPATAATTAAPTAGTTGAVTQSAASALLTGSAREEMVQNLMGLGFPRDQVELALRAAFNNPDRAADYLFNGIPDSALAAAGVRAGGAAPPATGTAAPATGGAGSVTTTPPTAAPASGGAAVAGAGAGLAGLAGLGGLGGAGNGNEGEAIRQLLQSNPQLIPALLQQLAQTNPDLVQQIQQNPAAFLQMLGASGALSGLAAGGAGGAGGGGAGRGGGRTHVIQITPEEKQSIDNLERLGFDRNRALEAFLLCDRNEELAANYLFENAAQFAEEDREAAQHGHAHGGSGGGGGGGGGDDEEGDDGGDFGDMPE